MPYITVLLLQLDYLTHYQLEASRFQIKLSVSVIKIMFFFLSKSRMVLKVIPTALKMLASFYFLEILLIFFGSLSFTLGWKKSKLHITENSTKDPLLICLGKGFTWDILEILWIVYL